jgi:hypothetical protein
MLQGKHHNGQFEVGYATQNVLPGDASLGIAPVGTRVETILRGRFDKTSNVIRGTATERYYSLEGGRWVLQQNDAGASDSEFVMERAPLLSSIVSVDPGTGLPSALANSNDPVALRASAH